jgi:hypothetical protein
MRTTHVADDEQQQEWPQTVDEAVGRLVAALREGEAQVTLHFSLGMSICNQFGRWRGNEPLLADCASRLRPSGRSTRLPIWRRHWRLDANSEHVRLSSGHLCPPSVRRPFRAAALNSNNSASSSMMQKVYIATY